MHTNRPWRAPDSEIAAASDVYRAHAGAGWWSRNLSHLASRWDCCLRAPMNLPACFKYDWLLERSAEKRRKFADDWIGLLADSDVLYQCSARELRQRFAAFNSPLVVSGERRWFPLPNDARDPFGPSANQSWKAKYNTRHRLQLYPNSGLLIGTSTGFESLRRGLRRTPRFPCCSYEAEVGGFTLDPCLSCRPARKFDKPVPCVVDDQACLQVALSSSEPPPHAIDQRARLFLNLNDLFPPDLAIVGGRLAFRPTGEVPCILHANGYKGILHRLAPKLEHVAWFAQRRGPAAELHQSMQSLRPEWRTSFALPQLSVTDGTPSGAHVRWSRLSDRLPGSLSAQPHARKQQARQPHAQ